METLALANFFNCSITPPLGEKMNKPSINEVLNYAKPLVRKFIRQIASDTPPEQQEEIEQTLYLRLIEAYAKIDAEAGWKSFVFNHCRGAVLDYLKFGKGFAENRWSLQNSDSAKNSHKINRRVTTYSETDDVESDIDSILGQNGLFSEILTDKVNIKWEIVAHLSAKDNELHAFAKYILGISIEEMAPVFGLCRTRVGQLIANFIDRFDDPKFADDPMFKQICFALGVCKILGMPEVDQRWVLGFPLVSSSVPPVNLSSLEPAKYLIEQDSQLSFNLEDGSK